MKLGKLAPRHDDRTLALARYVDLAALPTPPDATTRATDRNVAWPMFLNDHIGDCTCAGAAHLVQFWTALAAGSEAALADSDVLTAYEAITGSEGGAYDPVTGANDNGAVELDVLNYWRRVGVGNHRIQAYAAVALSNDALLRAAIWLFDGIYIGLALPASAQSQAVWDYTPSAGTAANPGSWGGHCVCIVDYNSTGPVYVTWGALKQATWAFHDRYCDEQYAIIAADEFTSGGKTVEGFDVAALIADLADVTGLS